MGWGLCVSRVSIGLLYQPSVCGLAACFFELFELYFFHFCLFIKINK